ncbi:MAG TPA: hypothetical protein VFN61_05925 [Acidimicrobiales bacterium]|nr:hypothetical protein [Acidimicrobiales bacterium]
MNLQVERLVPLDHPAVGGLALAGGWIWVQTTADLERVNPATGDIGARVAVPKRSVVLDLAGNPAGSVLAELQPGVLEFLDPSTGKAVSRYPSARAAGGYIAGVADGQVVTWTAAGHGSDIQRFVLKTRRFAPIYGWGYGAIIVVAGDRYLFEADAGYGARAKAPDYCGDTATGRPLAALPTAADLWGGRAVGYQRGELYYLRETRSGADLDEVALPACR